MSWFQENKFAASLGGATIAASALLFYAGSKGSSRYDAAKEEFDMALEEAARYEKSALYPKPENRDGKNKALTDYRSSIEELRASFDSFRPGEISNISPQEFTTRLQKASSEVVAAFEEAGTKLPPDFFLGFEPYKAALAQGGATGMLDLQLKALRDILLELAAAGPSELKNLHRAKLPEEDGKEYKPGDGAVARALPMELIFRASEPAARKFLNAVTDTSKHFTVVRAVRIANDKNVPPRSADAKFEQPRAAAAPSNDPFAGGGFVLPTEEGAEAATPAAAATPPPAAPSDSSRNLGQVLGNEELTIVLRMDVMSFLPAKKLP
jgi:hypothetical protein